MSDDYDDEYSEDESPDYNGSGDDKNNSEDDLNQSRESVTDSTNFTTFMVCGVHGVYVGRKCPMC